MKSVLAVGCSGWGDVVGVFSWEECFYLLWIRGLMGEKETVWQGIDILLRKNGGETTIGEMKSGRNALRQTSQIRSCNSFNTFYFAHWVQRQVRRGRNVRFLIPANSLIFYDNQSTKWLKMRQKKKRYNKWLNSQIGYFLIWFMPRDRKIKLSKDWRNVTVNLFSRCLWKSVTELQQSIKGNGKRKWK